MQISAIGLGVKLDESPRKIAWQRRNSTQKGEERPLKQTKVRGLRNFGWWHSIEKFYRGCSSRVRLEIAHKQTSTRSFSCNLKVVFYETYFCKCLLGLRRLPLYFYWGSAFLVVRVFKLFSIWSPKEVKGINYKYWKKKKTESKQRFSVFIQVCAFSINFSSVKMSPIALKCFKLRFLGDEIRCSCKDF